MSINKTDSAVFRKRNIILAMIFYLFGTSLSGQELVFEHFSSYDGLSNNLVRDIIQDKDGYLWFATSGGLNRFDGYYFDIYKPVFGDTLSLSESRLFELFVDSKGYVWARSSLGNVHRIDAEKKEVLNLKELGVIPPGTTSLAFEVSEWGDIWLVLDRGILRIYYPEDDDGTVKSQYFHTGNILPHNSINFIYPGANMVTWVGTADGLVKVTVQSEDNSNLEAERFFSGQNLSFISVKEIRGSIYFGTGAGNIIEFNNTTNSFNDLEGLDRMLQGNVTVMEANESGQILMGTDVGDILFVDNISGQNHYFRSGRVANLDAQYIDDIIADSYGLFWIISEKRGVFQFNPHTESFLYFGLNYQNRLFLGEPDKQTFFEDSNRNLWIGINGGGLFLYERESNTFRQYEHDPNNFSSLSSDIVLSLFEDRSKNLWIGTSYGGINKISLKGNQFDHIRPVEHPLTGFDNYIRSVITDPLGNKYVGSKAGKIFVYRGDNKIGTIPDDLYRPELFPATNIYCMYFDRDHNLWVGTKGNGIFVFKSFLGYFSNLRHQNIEVVHLLSDPSDPNSLSSNNIYSILQDSHGQYWIGTFTGGLDLLTDPFSDPRYVHYTDGDEGNRNIVSPEVRYLFLDNSQNLWIATSEGISILESRNLKSDERTFINIKPSLKDLTSLSGKVVYQIMQSSGNDIFVATLDGGINQLKIQDFEKREFNWIHFSNQNMSPNVYSIEEDNNGYLWMGTDNGLYRLSPKSQVLEKFRIRNSYLPLAFSESCSNKTTRNELIFGSEDGYIIFHPDSIHKDSSQFPVRFSRLEINGEHITNANSGILQNSIDAQEVLNLNYTQNNITLYFSVLDYDKPDAIQYSFFLEGYDNDWSNFSNSNYVNYRKLAPGNYTLFVKGTNSSGVLMDEIPSMRIIIHPSFWKSPKGYLLITLFSVLLVVSILIVVFRQISMQNKLKMESAITEKRIEYYTNISHEFKTPLSLILNPVEEIINSSKSSEFARQKGIQIRKNATYLKRLIDQILDFRKLREGKMQLRVSEINLVDFFREIYLVFLPLSTKLGIKFTFECNLEEYSGYADVRQMEKVAFNLLSNAFRFTPPGKTVKLSLAVQEEKKTMVFSVEDQGPGIDEKELPRIFDRFYMSKSSTGIGLFFTKELVFLHRGTIEASNKPEGGSVFIIEIPVDRSSYFAEEIDTSGTFHTSFDIKSIDDITTIIAGEEGMESQHQHKVEYLGTVLIVEDNEEMLRYLSSELSRKHKVLRAHDGETGLKMVHEYMPDLVLSDVKMPGMDGYELTRRIKGDFNTGDIPVILLTAEASEDQKIMGVDSGADDYIIKPFNLNYLLTKIDKTIIQRKQMKTRFVMDNKPVERETSPGKGSDVGFVSEVQRLIIQNLGNQKLNVEFLVEKMGISRTLFFKKVKASSGFSPNEYIRIERMKEAARLLLSTDLTVNEIGFKVGFNDSNYFGKSFKKHFGLTPSIYKQENSGKKV